MTTSRHKVSGGAGPTFSELFTPKLVTVLREGYGAPQLRADLVAGLTVAIVALPLAIAIAIASGASLLFVTNFVAITRSARLRTPAMSALFPALRAGSAAMGVPVHGNAFHTLLDIWPRPACEYEAIPVSPATVVTDDRVPLYNYCVTSNPALQVRGSANAPRPAVPDNGSGPPPGVRGDERAVPLPPR